MAARAQMVKELRDRTGAGVIDCKEALNASNDDLDTAVEYLRKKGIASAAKKAGREAKEGVVGSYIHAGAKLGVLVEINCESDFVARTEAFQELVKDIAMQVAAANPSYVAREDIPGEVLEKEREIYREQMADQKKAAQVIEAVYKKKQVGLGPPEAEAFEAVLVLADWFCKHPEERAKTFPPERALDALARSFSASPVA